MELLFWSVIGLALYVYLGYPLVAWVAGRVLGREVRRAPIQPRVSVVIAAYDEEDGIEARVRNVLASDYPPGQLEVVIASDGSSDATVERARAVADERVRVLDLPRRGKAAALAEGARHATGEILVFSDANTEFHERALAELVAPFADEEVGGVAARTEYVLDERTDSAGRGEDLYWRYDTWLKAAETRTGSVVSAHGGMYAIRRELFRPVEDPSVTDDFAISTAVVDQGKRLVFEPRAVAYERTMPEGGLEFRRRVRLMTRGLRSVLLRRRLLDPRRHGFYAVALASRKVLRRLVPLGLPVLLVTSLALAPTSRLYAAVAAAQLAALFLAALGWAARRTALGRSPALYAPLYFVLANAAAVLALWNVARGERIEHWTPQRHGAGTEEVAVGRAPVR
ncbi:MAG TPA: glycosyltransferase family 2 protein [Longimicrobiales bacterium]|nr:glycosyltransferase family 2 protein [Longimicrobiales bacterium]